MRLFLRYITAVHFDRKFYLNCDQDCRNIVICRKAIDPKNRRNILQRWMYEKLMKYFVARRVIHPGFVECFELSRWI